jgi:hypothetical protein
MWLIGKRQTVTSNVTDVGKRLSDFDVDRQPLAVTNNMAVNR